MNLAQWISKVKGRVEVNEENQLPVAIYSSIPQQESLTITGACTVAGNLTFDFVSAIAGCTKTLTIPVTTAMNSVELVAVAVRAALAADANIGANFTLGGGTGVVLATAKVAAPTDATLSMTLTRAGATGVTFGSSSNTTAGVLGVAQVETMTVTGAASADGTLTWTVIAAGMTGSPKGVSVAVTTADDSVTKVADKVRAALTADTNVSAFFTVSGTAGVVVLTRKTKAANDATMAMALTASGTGVTVSASADTTAGVAPVLQKETIAVTAGAVLGAGNITFRVVSAISGCTKNLVIPLLATDSTAELVAVKVRSALTADADIGAAFTVSGASGNVIVEAKVDAANDTTLEMSLVSAGATGVTAGYSTHVKGSDPQVAVANLGATSNGSQAQTASETAAALLLPAGITGPIFIERTNNGSKVAYTGGADVTVSNGFPRQPGDSWIWTPSPTNPAPQWIVTATGETSDIRSEVKGV